MKNIYIVACCADPTCLVLAENRDEAVKIAREQANKDLGDCDDNWTAYEISKYFADVFDTRFFGWIVDADSNYLS